MNAQDIKTRLTAAADQCVKCGLCLPHCPTYRLLRDEADSPRGRIALMQGWVEGRIGGSPSLQRHLGNCLQCRACESACPSLVRFGDMMDDARTLSALRSNAPRRFLRSAWLGILGSRLGTRLAALLGSVYRFSGLAYLVPRSPVPLHPTLAAMLRLLPHLRTPARIRQGGRGNGPEGEPIALFLGCIARSAQPGAVTAALSVLRRLGYDVDVPAGQVCCGAMYRHNGLPERAERLAVENAKAFDSIALVGTASACVAELRARQVTSGATEICRLLADLEWPETAALRPLARRVAVHVPCSQRNMLRDAEAASSLLRRIPGIDLVELPGAQGCCGAAGAYMIQRAVISQALLDPIMAEIQRLAVDAVVTTNTGCALHLAAGAAESGLDIEVLHPVELIARQLSWEDQALDAATETTAGHSPAVSTSRDTA